LQFDDFVPPDISAQAVKQIILAFCPPGRKQRYIGEHHIPFTEIKRVACAKNKMSSREFNETMRWLQNIGVINKMARHAKAESTGLLSLNIDTTTAATEGAEIIAVITRALAQKDRMR